MDIVELIETELRKRPLVDPEYRGKHMWIRCPYHGGGRERTGSLRIRMASEGGFQAGEFKCFGCQTKGKWNDLAATLKLRQTKLSDQAPGGANFSFSDADEHELPDLSKMQPWPESQPWRTITGETLTKLQARMLVHRNHLMVYLPVFVQGEYVGGIKAELVKPKNAKKIKFRSYVNEPGPWVDHALFNYDNARRMHGPLWVVEGPRDAAKLLQLGARVVALMGSNVTKDKLRLIEAMDPPLVIRATDPDAAGRKASIAIRDGLRYIYTIRVKFPEGKDPANLTEKSYRRYCKQYLTKYLDRND